MVDITGMVVGTIGEKAADSLARKGYTEQQQGMISAISPDYSPSRDEQIGDFLAINIFNRVAPGVGSAMTSINELTRMHEDAISTMAGEKAAEFNGREIPGFIEEQVEINGHTVTIYVDASATASGGKTRVYTDYDRHGISEEDMLEFERELRQHKRHFQHQAEEEVYDATVRYGEEGYIDRLERYVENSLNRDYVHDQSHAAVTPQPQSQPVSTPTATA
ncbi:MAG: hypothetical protein HRT94_01930 [Alphaproteobacteria bacterium]|nr:hypothetical protein [Alphaproteobacteria bacterium]